MQLIRGENSLKNKGNGLLDIWIKTEMLNFHPQKRFLLTASLYFYYGWASPVYDALYHYYFLNNLYHYDILNRIQNSN